MIRFNCRDAVWWWLRAILDYVSMSGSADILHDPVLRLYHSNDIPAREGDGVDRLKRLSLKEVVHEALQTHYTGLR